MPFNYAKNYIDKLDVDFVTKSLKSKSISQGKYLIQLENKFKTIFKSKYALVVSSGTAALHLSYLSLGLNKNDYIITTPLTWVATSNAALYCGAKVKLIDIDPNTLNIDLNKLEKFLSKTKKKPKIIVTVHFGGCPVDLKHLKKIARKHKISIVEDAAQALGAKYGNKLIGNCKYSEAVIFSLQPTKTITSGEGGVLLTNNKKVYETSVKLRRHGTVEKKINKWFDDINMLGFNYKIQEMSCALALSQIQKFRLFVKKRKFIHKKYLYFFKNYKVSFKTQKTIQNSDSSYHMFIFSFKNNISKIKKLNFFNYMKKRKINLTTKYLPIHMHSLYKKNFKNKNYKNSQEYFKQSFSLPLYYELKIKEVEYIVRTIRDAIIALKI